MKRRTTRLAALGLSAFFIAGTVSFPVHASEVPEDSGSSVFASKNNSSEEPKADIPESEETEESEDTPAVVQEQAEVSEEPGVEQATEPSSEQAIEEQHSETQQTESVVSVGDIE